MLNMIKYASSGDNKLRSAHAAKHVWVAVITNLESLKKKLEMQMVAQRPCSKSLNLVWRLNNTYLEIKQYIPGD